MWRPLGKSAIMMVRSRRLELPRPFGHSDLNAARLPVPPRPHVMKKAAAPAARLARRATSKGRGQAQCRGNVPAWDKWLRRCLPKPRHAFSCGMLFAAAIAIATAAMPAQPAAPRRQATATVRIVRAQPLNFAEIERSQPKTLRSSVIRGRDGQRETARLVEFQ